MNSIKHVWFINERDFLVKGRLARYFSFFHGVSAQCERTSGSNPLYLKGKAALSNESSVI